MHGWNDIGTTTPKQSEIGGDVRKSTIFTGFSDKKVLFVTIPK